MVKYLLSGCCQYCAVTWFLCDYLLFLYLFLKPLFIYCIVSAQYKLYDTGEVRILSGTGHVLHKQLFSEEADKPHKSAGPLHGGDNVGKGFAISECTAGLTQYLTLWHSSLGA